MNRPILFATDFTSHSDAALSYASALAAHSGVDLYIVHVSQALPTKDDPTPQYHGPSAILGAEESAAENLERTEPTHPGVRCERRLLHGAPAKQILRFAEEQDVGLIVIGSHGRTGLARLLMGSVAEEVTRESRRPVIVVKTPTPDPDQANEASE